MENFDGDYVEERISLLTPEERLMRLPTEGILKHFSVEELRKYLEKEKIKSKGHIYLLEPSLVKFVLKLCHKL